MVFIEIISIAFSSIYFLFFLVISFSRVSYPFTLEWVEGNTYIHIVRLLENKPIYIPPSFEFIPMIYPPLYYYLSAIIASITDQILFSMRLVSILSTLIIFIAIYWICRLRHLSREASFLAVGLFVASYKLMGFWLDIGRVDALFLALLLSGYVLTLISFQNEFGGGVGAGVVVFLSFATKQSAFVVFPFILTRFLLQRRFKSASWFTVSFVLATVLFVSIQTWRSNGWFWLYTFKIPAAHPITWEIALRSFWIEMIFRNYVWIIAGILLSFIPFFMKGDQYQILDQSVWAITFFLPLTIISVSSYAKMWGYANALMPIIASISILGAEAYQRVKLNILRRDNGSWEKTSLYFLFSTFLIVQFIALRYDFRTQIPSNNSRQAGNLMIKLIKETENPIFIPTSPYLLHLAGKNIHFHASSLGDIILASQNDSSLRADLQDYLNQISTYISSKSIKTAFLPNSTMYDHVFTMGNGYECESLIGENQPLSTFTGAYSYLERVCRFK